MSVRYLLEMVYRHMEENPNIPTEVAKRFFEMRKSIEGAQTVSGGFRRDFLAVYDALNQGRTSAAALAPQLKDVSRWLAGNQAALAGTLEPGKEFYEMQDWTRNRLEAVRDQMRQANVVIAEHRYRIRELARSYGISDEAITNMLDHWGDYREGILANIEAAGLQTKGLHEQFEAYDSLKSKALYYQKVLYGGLRKTDRYIPAMASLRREASGLGVQFDDSGRRITRSMRALGGMRVEFDKTNKAQIEVAEANKLSDMTLESLVHTLDGMRAALEDHRTKTSESYRELAKLNEQVSDAKTEFDGVSEAVTPFVHHLAEADATYQSFVDSLGKSTEELTSSGAAYRELMPGVEILQTSMGEQLKRVNALAESYPALSKGIIRLAAQAPEASKELFTFGRSLFDAEIIARDAMVEWEKLCTGQREYMEETFKTKQEVWDLSQKFKPLVKVLMEQYRWLGASTGRAKWAYDIWEKYRGGVKVSKDELERAYVAIRENEQAVGKQAYQMARHVVLAKKKEEQERSLTNRMKKAQRTLQRYGYRLGWVGYRMVMMGRIIMRWMLDPIRKTISALTNWEKSLESTAMTMGLLAATGELTGERQEFLMDTMMRLLEVGPAFQAAFGYLQTALLRLMIEAGEPLLGLFRTLGDFIANLTPLIQHVLVPAVTDLINQFVEFLPVLRPIVYEALPWFLLGVKTTIPALMTLLAIVKNYIPMLAFFAGILAPLAPLFIAFGMACYFLSPILMGLQYVFLAVTTGITLFTKTIPLTIISLQNLTWSIVKFKLEMLLMNRAFQITIVSLVAIGIVVYYLYRRFTESMEKMRKSVRDFSIDMKLSASSMAMVITDEAGNILYSIDRMTGEVTDAQGNIVGTIDWASGVIVDKYGNVIGIIDDTTHTFRDSSGNIIGYVKSMADDIDESMDRIASSLDGLSADFEGLEGSIDTQTGLMEQEIRNMRWIMYLQGLAMVAAINPVAAAIAGIGIAVWELMPYLEEWLADIGVFEDTLEGWLESLEEVNEEIAKQLGLLDDLGERLDAVEDDMDTAAVKTHEMAEELRDMGIDVDDTSHLLDDVRESIDKTTKKSEEFADAIDEYVCPEIRALRWLVNDLKIDVWGLLGGLRGISGVLGVMCFTHAAAGAREFSDSLRDVISLTKDTERVTSRLGGALGGVGGGGAGVGGHSPAIGGGAASPQYVYVYPSITIETVSGIADLGMVTDAVSEGIADAVRRRKP